MLTVIVGELMASIEGCNDVRIPLELDARVSSRNVVLHSAGQMLVLALIGSGSDYYPGPGWKTLTGWFNSALVLLWLGPSLDRTTLASPGSGWSRLSLVWFGIANPTLAQP